MSSDIIINFHLFKVLINSLFHFLIEADIVAMITAFLVLAIAPLPRLKSVYKIFSQTTLDVASSTLNF
jgi:hypothetical protein